MLFSLLPICQWLHDNSWIWYIIYAFYICVYVYTNIQLYMYIYICYICIFYVIYIYIIYILYVYIYIYTCTYIHTYIAHVPWLCTNVYLMYLSEMTGANSIFTSTKYMVLHCSKLFYYKVSRGFLRQDSESSYSFGKIQNVGET